MKVEWLILADWVQVIGNKLYLQGGGWDTLTVNTGFPVQQSAGLAASFVVPWEATNQRHHVELEMLTEDGASIAKTGGQFEVGRPPGIKPGQSQRFQMSANFNVQLDKPGTYVIVARIEEQEGSRIHFNVVPGPMLSVTRQQGAA